MVLNLGNANMAFAGDSSCDAKAVEKKLNGAAKTRFVNKCTKDAAVATSSS